MYVADRTLNYHLELDETFPQPWGPWIFEHQRKLSEA